MKFTTKTQSFQVIRSAWFEFFWFHVEDQSILGGGTVQNFLKNLFNQKLLLFVYKKHEQS